MDDANPVGEALAIRGSTIIGVGSLTEVKRHYTPGTEIVDLKGHAVLPGFVEPHVELFGGALSGLGGLAAPGDPAASGDPVRRGDPAASGDPVRRGDPAASGDPVRRGDHAGSAFAKDAAELLAKDPDRLAELLRGTLRELASRGCTTVYDPGIGRYGGVAEHELLRSLAHAPDAPLRVRGAFTPKLAAELGAGPDGGGERYGVVGIALWADGAIQDFAAALGEPYADGRDNGRLEYEEAELREAMRTWYDRGWQLVVQANGDRAIEQVLRCYEAILAEGQSQPAEAVLAEGRSQPAETVLAESRSQPAKSAPEFARHRAARHRIECFALAGDEQIARAGALGLGCTHPINDVYFFGENFRDHVLGTERAARIHSLRRELEHGVVSSCYSGSSASPVDPCLSLRTATTRLMRDSDDVLGPFQQLKLDEALRMVTCNPAQQVLLGDRVGALRPGMLADLVVLDRDPRATAPERLEEIRVLETWLGGRRQQWA
jgi:predicted amidohydrolase YtcJ